MASGTPENSYDNWRIVVLRRDLVRHARSIERLAARLEKIKEYPTETAASFCKVIRRTAELFAKKLESAPDAKLYHIHSLLSQLGEHLRFPDRSRIEQTPWSLVQAIEAFLKRHVGQDCSFIIRPQWAYNYSIVLDFYGHYRRLFASLGDWISVSEWESAIDDPTIRSRVFCISFPRVERFNVLLHVNLGHEVGHILAGQWMSKRFGDLWAKAEPTIRAQFEKEHPSKQGSPEEELSRQVLIAHGLKETMNYARIGLTELISDRIGLHLFGPAAVAALVEFSAKFEPLDTSPTATKGYPPWRLRLRKSCEAIGDDLNPELGHDKTVTPFIAFLIKAKSLTLVRDDLDEIESDPFTREAYKIIEDNWSAIIPEVLAELPAPSSAPYRISSEASIVNQLVVRLEHNLPPNEAGSWPHMSPVSLANIWNAGWAFVHYKLDADNEWGTPENYDNVCRLILKALEATFVYETYVSKLGETP